MYPSREEFTELIYYISELKHQYSGKIDEQTIKINDQSGVIEELLWQIRELSDKLRQMSQRVIDVEKAQSDNRRKVEENSCVCRYQNHFTKNRSIFSRQNSTISRKSSAKVAKRVDKTIDNVDDLGDENDVYETIEFSDSSSHVYTEPVRDYGILRRVNIKTSPRQHTSNKKPPSGMKKSAGARNLQKFQAMQDVSTAGTEVIEENVPLRTKPDKQPEMNSTSNNNKAISDLGLQSIQNTNLDSFTQPRDVSGILINFGCSNSRLRSDIQDRLSY